MPKSLQEFYNDVDTRNNVHNYLVEFLKEEAVRKIFDKEDVSAVSEAKEMIDKAFDNMSVMFQKKIVNKDQINPSR